MNLILTDKRGFTLIELAAVLVIGGILIGGFSGGVISYMKEAQLTEDGVKLDRAYAALDQFVRVRGYLPCPASLTAETDTAEYAHGEDDCTVDTAGTTKTADNLVRIGALPTRMLSISDDDMVDSQGNELLYAVTIGQTKADTFASDGGEIEIHDRNGNTVADDIQFVVMSHGRNGTGAYTRFGKQRAACQAAQMDGENCDNDKVFLSTLQSSATGSVFDDALIYGSFLKPETEAGEGIPSGALSAFNLTTCPPAWSPVPETAGRTIIAAGEFEPKYDDVSKVWGDDEDPPNSALDPITYPLHRTGGTVREVLTRNNLPPHRHTVPSDTTDVRYGGPNAGGIPVYFKDNYYINAYPNSILGTTSGNAMNTEEHGAFNAEGNPHENRAPYMVFLFCKKD